MTEKQNFFKFKDGKPVGAVIYSHGKIMNEKRFYKQKSTIEDYMIYDDDKEDAYFISCKDESNADYLVDLLNALHEENMIFREFIELNDFDADEIIRQGRGLE